MSDLTTASPNPHRRGSRALLAAVLLLAATVAAFAGFGAGRSMVVTERATEAFERRREEARDKLLAEKRVRSLATLRAAFDAAFALDLRRRHPELIEARLAATFAKLGAIPGVDPVDAVVAKLIEAGADAGFAPRFDDWAGLRRATGAELDPRPLVEVARRLDPEPQRDRLRLLLADRSSSARLRDLAANPEVEPWDAPAITLLGQVLAADGELALAVRLLERAVRRFPGDFELRLVLADALFRQGRPAAPAAQVHYSAALALEPRSRRANLHLGWLLLDPAAEASAALVALTAAGHRLPEDPGIAWGCSVALLRERHVEEARQELQRALTLDPRFALAQAGLGDVFLAEEFYAEAQAEFEKSLALCDTPDARHGLAVALERQGRLREAVAAADEGVKRHPRDAELRDMLATTLVLSGEFAAGLAHLKEAVRLDPWSAQIRNDYAWELVNSGDPKLRRPGQAIEHAQRAVELDPQNAFFHNTLGVVWYRIGEYRECVAELEANYDLPDGGTSYDLFFLAMAKQQLGDRDAALDLFARATVLMDDTNEELGRVRAEAALLLELGKGGGP